MVCSGSSSLSVLAVRRTETNPLASSLAPGFGDRGLAASQRGWRSARQVSQALTDGGLVYSVRRSLGNVRRRPRTRGSSFGWLRSGVRRIGDVPFFALAVTAAH